MYKQTVLSPSRYPSHPNPTPSSRGGVLKDDCVFVRQIDVSDISVQLLGNIAIKKMTLMHYDLINPCDYAVAFFLLIYLHG